MYSLVTRLIRWNSGNNSTTNTVYTWPLFSQQLSWHEWHIRFTAYFLGAKKPAWYGHATTVIRRSKTHSITLPLRAEPSTINQSHHYKPGNVKCFFSRLHNHKDYSHPSSICLAGNGTMRSTNRVVGQGLVQPRFIKPFSLSAQNTWFSQTGMT